MTSEPVLSVAFVAYAIAVAANLLGVAFEVDTLETIIGGVLTLVAAVAARSRVSPV